MQSNTLTGGCGSPVLRRKQGHISKPKVHRLSPHLKGETTNQVARKQQEERNSPKTGNKRGKQEPKSVFQSKKVRKCLTTTTRATNHPPRGWSRVQLRPRRREHDKGIAQEIVATHSTVQKRLVSSCKTTDGKFSHNYTDNLHTPLTIKEIKLLKIFPFIHPPPPKKPS